MANGLAEAEVLEEIAGAGLGHGNLTRCHFTRPEDYSAFLRRHEAVSAA